MVIPGDLKIAFFTTKTSRYVWRKRVIFTSKPYFLEVLPANTGKGEALKYPAETVLNIPKEETMSFGDSMNDESMIKYAAHSTAMINGLDYIKK